MSNVVLYIALGAILAPSNLCAPLGSTTRKQATASKIEPEGTTVDVGTVNDEEEDKTLPENSLPATKSALSIEAEEELKVFGIENAHPNLKLFAKNQVKQVKKKDETISKKDNEISKKDNEIGELRNEKKKKKSEQVE